MAALIGELLLVALFGATPASLADDVQPAPSSDGTTTTVATDPAATGTTTPTATDTTTTPTATDTTTTPTATDTTTTPTATDTTPTTTDSTPPADTTTTTDPAPTDTTSADTVQTDTTTTSDPTPTPNPQSQTDTQTATTDQTANATANPTDPTSDAPIAVAGTSAGAQALIIQAIWQEQTGCQTYCWSTTLTQSADQSAAVDQTATSGSSSATTPGTATAVNDASVFQIVFQSQIGCVAFCYETTQTQSASQLSSILQSGTAAGDWLALVVNATDGFQMVLQQQQGCQQECYGTSMIQLLSQAATLQQSDASQTLSATVFFSAVSAIAQALGATFQSIVQTQTAACLDHCRGDVQIQAAAQLAKITQLVAANLTGPIASEPPVAPVTTGDSVPAPNPDTAGAVTTAVTPVPAAAARSLALPAGVGAPVPVVQAPALPAAPSLSGPLSTFRQLPDRAQHSQPRKRGHGSRVITNGARVINGRGSAIGRALTAHEYRRAAERVRSGSVRADLPSSARQLRFAETSAPATPDRGGMPGLLLIVPAILAFAGFGISRIAGSFRQK